MRTLIISDIHANFTALKAVLEHATPFDRVWCLGDLIGYGPDPNECVDAVRELPGIQCIKGNHDAALLGEIDITAFNDEARRSLEWLREIISTENYRWLGQLGEMIELGGITLVHGSPRNSVWEYIADSSTAFSNMAHFSSRVCLVGHTHLPGIYQLKNDTISTIFLNGSLAGEPIQLDDKCIVNPGSVGQPRDHDPRASYLLFDDEKDEWMYQRVAYDVKSVQKRIIDAGLPSRHAARLEFGY